MSVNPADVRCDPPLFVPANKSERLIKALALAHDAVIIDLEDAVTPEAKITVRVALADMRPHLDESDVTVFVRAKAIRARATRG